MGGPSWADIDRTASKVFGFDGIGVPSLRVAIRWILEYHGLRRHADHVLVPRFVGRCILNTINRQALPVESCTDRTRAAIVVDQFGMRQDMAAISRECRERGLIYIEDSPCGVASTEAPSDGAAARLIGLTKALPIVQGGLVVTRDAALKRFLIERRDVVTPWSRWMWLVMWSQRRHAQAPPYSPLANAAYEMYADATGGHGWMRGNIAAVLAQLSAVEREQASRMAAIASRLGAHALLPSTNRVGYVVPVIAGDATAAAQAVLARFGFDRQPYHVDVNRNLFSPNYVPALLLPLGHRIPRVIFDGMLAGLAEALAPAAVAAHA